MREKLVLIDGHSILNRAFFGIPDLTNAEGLHTNAVYGFLNIMFKILDEEKPDYLTVAFDVHAKTFRHKMYEAYKGTRKPMAAELREQVPLMKEMLRAMGVCIVEKEGYEADDLLGTMARLGEEADMEVSVVSGDRDLLQLATHQVKIRIPKTKRNGTEIEDYYADDVKERYQVTPKEFIDVKALMGDTADNIPGVPGIGEKTATAIISTYGSIEKAYENIEQIKPNRARENFKEYYEQAQLSKVLATIDVYADIAYDFADARLSDLYTQDAYVLCKRLEFKNLLSKFEVEGPSSSIEEGYHSIETEQELDDIFARLKPGQHISFEPVKCGSRILGCGICTGSTEIYGICFSKELTSDMVFVRMCQSLKQGIRLSCLDLKESIKRLGISKDITTIRTQCFDVSIAAYLLNPLIGDYPFDEIAKNHLDLLLPSVTDLFGKVKLEQAPQEKPQEFFRYLCSKAYVSYAAEPVLRDKIDQMGMTELYMEYELPLTYVLAGMEEEGIYTDRMALQEYGDSLVSKITQLEQSIYEQAGEEFNINSPKQLGVILFEKLKMPNAKKTKTGYSTAADVLDKLAVDYPIVADILEYRQLSKLKSTYADGLAGYIDEQGRIHTTFKQTITATGRLSSTEPNLQNIPIRMELGRMIRKVFLPGEGCVFVDADYSQIELRVLAHMSKDEKLIEAYRQNRDIHRTTASQVFHIPFEEVTDLQRRNAKAVNFGIVYGISSFGLSQDLGISKKEAADYMARYFETYPKIKDFLEGLVTTAKETGYSKTLYGRRRPMPELSSSNFMQRSFGERVAMNAPIQGTAADIIKMAMIRVYDRIIREQLESRLILQVHDELLIECKQEEEEIICRILKEEMKAAAELEVELEVDMHSGHNWYEAK